ncbi:HNH endonuclease signature motif containing protein [Streptomyces olivoreticuli]|uniref:HNH endonuclease signature motif containing protein n=1 Tax=Streptomyces olivoreticuli TaxID=68246 RepID=UPI000E232000
MRNAALLDPRDLRRMEIQSRSGVDGAPCILWTGALDGGGYAMTKRNGRSSKVHRLMYESIRGEIPSGLVLDHLCRVRHCVNPAHLEAVSNAENVRRGSNTKLTMADAMAIRDEFAQPNSRTKTAIAAAYGVSRTAVRLLLAGETWVAE